MDRTLYPYQQRLRTRYNEADPQRIIFNGNYFIYFDVAFTDWLHHLNIGFGSIARHNTDFVVAEVKSRFYASARPLEELTIGVRCAHLGNTSMVIEIQIEREADATLIAVGQIAYICVDAETFKSKPVPDHFRETILRHEGGLKPPTGVTRILDRHIPAD